MKKWINALLPFVSVKQPKVAKLVGSGGVTEVAAAVVVGVPATGVVPP